MATVEEAREAVDGQEVQVALDLGTSHLQTHLDSKLPFNKEIKDDAKNMDSTEGMLISEDQVLVEAPSEVKIPPELNLNGTTSLNGLLDNDDKISKERLDENDHRDKEQTEVSPDKTSTNQSNNSNDEEAIDSLGHGKSTIEDTSLLKHENDEHKENGQQELEGDVIDNKMVQEDTSKIDNAAEPTLNLQQGQNLESEKVIEDTHPASMSNILDGVSVAEAPVGVKFPQEHNMDDSTALAGAIDGNTEPVEPDKVDGIAHLDHKGSSPEDKDSSEHIDEVATMEDQQRKQTAAVDRDVVQEEIPKSKETEVQEEMPQTEQADDSTIDAQVLNQESSKANEPVHEEILHQSSVATSEETTPEQVAMGEPTVDIQEVQNQGSLEEIADTEAVDTEKITQQSNAAFEEEIPEHYVATTAPSSDIQHVNNEESEEIKGLEDASESSVASADAAVQDKVLLSEPIIDIQPVQGLEKEETENAGSVEMDEASNQTPADLSQEDSIAASEPRVTELAENVDDIEATETQEIIHQLHVATSEEVTAEDNSTASEPHNDDIQQALEQDLVEVKDIKAAETKDIETAEAQGISSEDTVEDIVTAGGPTCDTQEVQSTESQEEIEDNIAENIVEVSDATTVDKADQGNYVLTSEANSEQQAQRLDPEEMKNTEPVETEAPDQKQADLFNDLAQEDNTTENEMQKMEQAVETKEIEDTEKIPQESNAFISEELTTEDNIAAYETQEVNNVGSAEETESKKDPKTGEIPDEESSTVEAAEATNALESEANADIQPVQELESKEMINTELVESEISHQMDDAVFQKPIQEDNPTTSELHVMERAEVSNIEATEAEATLHQTNAAQSEEQATEGNTTPQIQEEESIDEMKDTDATEPQGISQQRIISTSEESAPEEYVTAEEPGCDDEKVQNEEPELIKEDDDVKAQENNFIASGAVVEEAAQENSSIESEQTNDVQGLESEEIKKTEDAGTEEDSNQTHIATVEENLTASEARTIESSEKMNGIETTRPEQTLHESNNASLEEMANEDNTIIGPDSDIQQLQEQESVKFKDNEAIEHQGISPSHIVSTPEESMVEDNITKTEPGSDTQAENLESAEVIKDDEDVKSNVALAEETPEKHILESQITIDVLPVQETEIEETKNTEPAERQHNIIASGLPLEEGTETMKTEAIPESTVASIAVLTEDMKSNISIADEAATEEHVLATHTTVDTPQVQEPELEEVKDTEPVEVEDTKTARELPDEEMNDDGIMEDEGTKSKVAIADEEATKEHVLATDIAVDTPQVQEPELQEIKDTELVEVEDTKTTSNMSAEEANEAGTMETEDIKSNVALAEEATTKELILEADMAVDTAQVQELELEGMKDTGPAEVEDTKTASDLPGEEINDATTIETEDMKSNAALADEATAEEHVLAADTAVDTPQSQEPELEEIKDIEPVEVEDNKIASNLPAEEINDAGTMETEIKSNAALVDEATTEEHVLATDTAVDTPLVQKPELEEIKNTEPVEGEDNKTARDLPAEEMSDAGTLESEAISHESTVTRIKELTEDGSLTACAPHADIQLVLEQETVEDTTCTDTTEYQGESQQSIVCTSDKQIPTEEKTAVTEVTCDAQVHNIAQEIKDSENVKTKEFYDHNTFSTPEVAAQESGVLENEPTSDTQQVQEQSSTEEARGIEAVEVDSHQRYRASTLEKIVPENTVANSETKVDEEVQEKSSVEVKDIEAMQTEEISDQSNITTSQNAAQESSELQSKFLEDSKGGQLVKAEEPGQSSFAIIEEPATEDNAAKETGPPGDIKQEHELESVEEIKDIDATEAEEASYISQAAALEEPSSESNTGTTDLTCNIQQLNDLGETKETNSNEDIDDEEISKQQAYTSALEDQSSTDNVAAPEELPTESNKENFGNEINNEGLMHEKIKNEIQEPKELKDETSNLGEKAVCTAQRGENITEVDAVQSSGEVTIETSHNIDQIKEEENTITKHDSSELVSSDLHEENIAPVQDRGINGELLTESGKEEVSQASFETEPQAAQDVAEEDDDTIKGCEQTSDQDDEQHQDLVLRTQLCEKSIDNLAIGQQDQDVQKVLDQQQKEGEDIEEQTREIQADEQKHDEKNADFTIETLGEPKSIEDSTNKTEDTDAFEVEQTETVVTEMLNNESTVHAPQEVIPSVNVENTTETKEGTEEESEPRNAGPVDADAENLNEDEPENTGKDEAVTKASTDEQYGTTDEIRVEEDKPDLSSYVEKDQEISESAPSNEMKENLEPEENALDKIAETELNEKMEASYTTATEAVTFNENISDKASGTDEALSNESLKTVEDTRRDLDVSYVVTELKGESINEIEDHRLALPAQPTLDKNTIEQASGLEETEGEMPLPEQLLPAESEEKEENQITKEQDEEVTHESEIGDMQIEAEENDLPVSNFLMNLILGKENNVPEGTLDSEAETRQEETTKDDSCLVTSQQEGSASLPAESKVDDKFTFEQEKQNVEGSEEIHEMLKEQIHDFKMDTERSLETDEELNRKTHDTEAPVYQDNSQDKVSSDVVPTEATGLVTEMETRDFELDERTVNTICQEDVEAITQTEEGSLNRNLDDSSSPKASQEDTLDGGRSDLQYESSPEDRSSDAVAEQTLSLTESDMGDAEKLPGLQGPLCTVQEQSNEFSNVDAKSTEVQLESGEVDKKEENQHATTGGATEDQIENLHACLHSEAISDEQAPEITEPVSGTDINLVHTMEVPADSAYVDEKESYNFSNNEETLEIQQHGSNLHINQDKHDLSADSQSVIEENLLEKPGESNLQEQHETDTVQKPIKETDGGYQKSLVMEEPVIKEENVHETVENHVQTINTKPNVQQEVNLQVQERDFHVVSPKEAPEVEESFVEITKPEFSTDEEQSPKADESNAAEEKTYDEKTKNEEEAKNFTDEGTMKIEERGAGQKTSPKKYNILSGVGSKVKHQLAKVKKAIIGKPGHTKSESPKS